MIKNLNINKLRKPRIAISFSWGRVGGFVNFLFLGRKFINPIRLSQKSVGGGVHLSGYFCLVRRCQTLGQTNNKFTPYNKPTRQLRYCSTKLRNIGTLCLRSKFFSGAVFLIILFLILSLIISPLSLGLMPVVLAATDVCPTGYIKVPGDSVYGTVDFCVAKYEMKNVGGVATSQADVTSWVSITQYAAQDACRALGSDYHLITNQEWMTIARDVEQVASNWTGGSVGSGLLERGNVGITDAASYDGANPEYGTGRDSKAELALSNGETIWDLSGNVWEWVDETLFEDDTGTVTDDGHDEDGITGGEMPERSTATTSRNWYELTELTSYGQYSYEDIRPSNSSWNYAQGMGRIYLTPGHAYNGTGYLSDFHAFLRGGYWSDGAYAGVFTLNLNNAPADTHTLIGFRCSSDLRRNLKSNYLKPSVFYNFDTIPGASYVRDQAGGGNLTLAGNATIEPGLNGAWALKLDGTGDYASAVDSRDLSPQYNFSIEAYVKANSLQTTSGNIQAVASKWDENGLRSYRLILYTDSTGRTFPRFEVSSNGSAATGTVTGQTQIIANTWYLLTGVYNTASSGTIDIYVNGYQDASSVTSAGTSIHDNSSNFVFGATENNGSYSNYLTGFVDEAKLYEGTRSFNSIAYPYDRGRPLVKFTFDDGGGLAAHNTSEIVNLGYKFAHLINFSTASAWTDGYNNYALQFDGSDDYLDIGPLNAIQLGSGLTISAWISPSTLDGDMVIVSRSDNGGYMFKVTSAGELSFGDRDGTPITTSSGAGISVGNWQHVTVSYDGVTAYFLVDGRYIGSGAVALSRNDGSVLVGSTGSANYFSGKMDNLIIYPYPRTYAENSLDYNDGFALKIGQSQGLAPKNIQIACPTDYIPVPGNPLYGTSDFCVAKYEMKNVGGVATSQASGNPWVSISQTDSITECSDLGSKYHLITNAEWMTIARNVEQVASNWSGNSYSSGDFARGWAANTSYGDAWTNTAVATSTGSSCLYNTAANTCGSTGTHLYRRTHTLSNGEEIWDLSGNVWEWASDTIACAAAQCTTSEMPYDSTPASEWIEFTALNTYGELSYDKIRPSNSSWSSTEDLGRVYTDYDAAYPSGNTHAFLRGGIWSDGAGAGVFTLSLGTAPANTSTYIGFRCSSDP